MPSAMMMMNIIVILLIIIIATRDDESKGESHFFAWKYKRTKDHISHREFELTLTKNKKWNVGSKRKLISLIDTNSLTLITYDHILKKV